MIPTYPDDTIQALTNNWWVEDKSSNYKFGRLINAYLPHVDQIPYQLITTGRNEPTNHNSAMCSLKPLKIRRSPCRPKLPVAALPYFENEVRTVYRAKIRPALIVSEGGDEVEQALRQGYPRWQTAPHLLVIPFYGVFESSRAGFPPAFINRVQKCIYPQFYWDILPAPPSKRIESIAKLDHLQPVGRHHDTISLSHFRLSDEACEVIQDWIFWLISGQLCQESLLFLYKSEISRIDEILSGPDI